jgi:hypothetical protein
MNSIHLRGSGEKQVRDFSDVLDETGEPESAQWAYEKHVDNAWEEEQEQDDENEDDNEDDDQDNGFTTPLHLVVENAGKRWRKEYERPMSLRSEIERDKLRDIGKKSIDELDEETRELFDEAVDRDIIERRQLDYIPPYTLDQSKPYVLPVGNKLTKAGVFGDMMFANTDFITDSVMEPRLRLESAIDDVLIHNPITSATWQHGKSSKSMIGGSRRAPEAELQAINAAKSKASGVLVSSADVSDDEIVRSSGGASFGSKVPDFTLGARDGIGSYGWQQLVDAMPKESMFGDGGASCRPIAHKHEVTSRPGHYLTAVDSAIHGFSGVASKLVKGLFRKKKNVSTQFAPEDTEHTRKASENDRAYKFDQLDDAQMFDRFYRETAGTQMQVKYPINPQTLEQHQNRVQLQRDDTERNTHASDMASFTVGEVNNSLHLSKEIERMARNDMLRATPGKANGRDRIAYNPTSDPNKTGTYQFARSTLQTNVMNNQVLNTEKDSRFQLFAENNTTPEMHGRKVRREALTTRWTAQKLMTDGLEQSQRVAGGATAEGALVTMQNDFSRNMKRRFEAIAPNDQSTTRGTLDRRWKHSRVDVPNVDEFDGAPVPQEYVGRKNDDAGGGQARSSFAFGGDADASALKAFRQTQNDLAGSRLGMHAAQVYNMGGFGQQYGLETGRDIGSYMLGNQISYGAGSGEGGRNSGDGFNLTMDVTNRAQLAMNANSRQRSDF